MTALAGMGLLTDDEALLDAALSEMLSLPAEEQHQRDPGRYVDMLLRNYSLAQVTWRILLKLSFHLLGLSRVILLAFYH